ncbi:hypothetical protein ES705_28955 [subsurface metagenome]
MSSRLSQPSIFCMSALTSASSSSLVRTQYPLSASSGLLVSCSRKPSSSAILFSTARIASLPFSPSPRVARSQMEYVKNQDYEWYNPSAPPSYTIKDGEKSSSHLGYFIWVDAFPIDPDTGEFLTDPDTGEFLTDTDTGQPYYDEDLQKIIVTIKHGSEAEAAKELLTLEDYKVDR